MASLRGLVLLVAQVLLDSTTYFIQTYVFFVVCSNRKYASICSTAYFFEPTRRISRQFDDRDSFRIIERREWSVFIVLSYHM
jgi:hypothetical protein